MSDETGNELFELQKKAKACEFYGETLIRWEKGEPVLIENTQKFKPKDFRSIVFQVVAVR